MAGLDLQRIFDIAGSALNAQSVRMNTIASNLANVGTEASSEAEAFRAKRTVLKGSPSKGANPWRRPRGRRREGRRHC